MSLSHNERSAWIEPVKALALIGILWNHFLEEFCRGPWFTNPSSSWGSLSTRLQDIFPTENGLGVGVLQMIGWLGDSCPGVFILISGFALTMSAFKRSEPVSAKSFYKKRLARLFPLYVVMHFFFFAIALLIPATELSVGHRRSLLSLLGLRFTEGLFFYISPSWWFMWLILQLYVLFPVLFKLLQKVRVATFIAITCGATFLFRGLALSGIHTGDNVFFTLMGMFCGTRLAEFSAGMVLARLAVYMREASIPEPRVFIAKCCLASYLIGFVTSWFWYGGIVSNLLVSVGITGLLYFCYASWASNYRSITKVLDWIGAESFGIFLIHQPLMIWSKHLFEDASTSRIVAVGVALVLSFPLACLVRLAVGKTLKSLANWKQSPGTTDFRSQFILALPATLGFVYLLLYSEGFSQSPRLDAFIVAVLMMATGLLQWVGDRRLPRLAEANNVAFLTAGLARLYILPDGNTSAALVLGGAFSLVFAIVRTIGERREQQHSWFRTTTIAGAASLSLAFVLEVSLWRIAPLETAAWGELPALTTHETRGYGLKPNLDLRLRYNNYDYQLKTNSLGLVGPEINVQRQPGDFRILVLGDAFTMPEGVEYEKSYPALLESMLKKHSVSDSVEVISAGVTGYGPRETLAQLQELAPLLKPDLVIYQFFVNEFGEVALEPEFRRQAIGIEPMGSIDQQIFSNTQLITWSEKVGTGIKEGLIGSSDHWRYQKALLHYLRAGESQFYSKERVLLVKQYLNEIKRVTDQTGSGLSLMYVPAAAAVTSPQHMTYFPREVDLANSKRFDINRPRRLLMEIAENLKIPLLDLTEPLHSHLQQPVYFPESWHWNSTGHKVAAQELARFLMDKSGESE